VNEGPEQEHREDAIGMEVRMGEGRASKGRTGRKGREARGGSVACEMREGNRRREGVK
jgi:hypothetical protein